MEPTHQVSLTPEQLAAINAGGGFAHCEDPATHVHYHLIQYELPTLDDDYIREKLAEAQADIDRGNVADWDVEEINRELHARLANKQAGK
jgi:hypothetical protein